MKQQRTRRISQMTFGLILTGSLWCGSVLAQPPGGPPPGGPGRGGPGRGGPRPVTALDAPISVLVSGLQLSDQQKTSIETIRNNFQTARRNSMPRPGNGERPDPETMRANMEAMRAKEQQANQRIIALLNADQKQALPALLKEIEVLRITGIPAELYSDLNLSADQKRQLVAIADKAKADMRQRMGGPGGPGGGRGGDQGGPPPGGERGGDQGGPPPGGGRGGRGGNRGGGRGGMDMRRQTEEKAMAVLTAEQKALVEKFKEEHPRPDGPPRDGFGPPRGGDGPPPPSEGDGPPPPPPGDVDNPPPSA